MSNRWIVLVSNHRPVDASTVVKVYRNNGLVGGPMYASCINWKTTGQLGVRYFQVIDPAPARLGTVITVYVTGAALLGVLVFSCTALMPAALLLTIIPVKSND